MIKFLTNLWKNFKEYIVLVILVITSLVVLSQNRNPQVQKFRAVAFGSFAAVTSLLSDLFNTQGIKQQNEELRKINAELMLHISLLREYGIENSELKSLLNFKDSVNLPLKPANVISKSLSVTQNTLTLNVGLKDSVQVGMPVINYAGLIGIVLSTSDDFSIVRTIRNVDLKIAVKNERNRVNGIMKWDGEKLFMNDVSKSFDFEIGDRIVTSEFSSIIAIPIPVGVVQKVNNTETGVFNQIIIQPFANILKVEDVLVLRLVQSKQKENLELNFFNR
jgi:rod shape-determining protein MreC